MAASTATHVAEALINLSHEKRSPLTNLKLQKLLYYAQAWHLVLKGECLFDDDVIDAWVHGPVIPTIFRRYREYRWNPIHPIAGVRVTPTLKKHLEEIWKVYGKFDASRLERITHTEQPWIDARGDLSCDAPSHHIITKRSMKAYYSSLLKNA